MDEFNALEEILSQSMGIDKNKEIFNLWYEVVFLRNMLNLIISNNHEIGSCINQYSVDLARGSAQGEVMKRFPNCSITFTDPQTPTQGVQNEETNI